MCSLMEQNCRQIIIMVFHFAQCSVIWEKINGFSSCEGVERIKKKY